MSTVPGMSKAVTLTITPVLAAAFVGCDDEETAYCVNAQDEVVENQHCGDEDDGGSSAFFWYYGGRAIGGADIRRGTRLTGGSARIVSTDKAAIKSRGGFGSSQGGSSIGRVSG
jgi:hypothetical protein